jgi:DNA-binding CsgD family transcriptional regulator
MSGKLNEHLYEIDQTANDRFWLITNQIAKAEGITEQLKVENQMLWVQKMNNIRNRVEEIIKSELIYA